MSLYKTNEFGSFYNLANTARGSNSSSSANLRRRISGDQDSEQTYTTKTANSLLSLDQGSRRGSKDKNAVSEAFYEAPNMRRSDSINSLATMTNDFDQAEKPFLRFGMERTSSRASTLIDTEIKLCGNQGKPSFASYEKNPPNEHVLYSSRAKRDFWPPLYLVGPAIAALLLTAGLATVMVVWIHTHKLPLQSDGVIFVREGVEDEPDRLYTDSTLGPNDTLRFNTKIAHSTGLSFSTVISTLVGWSICPLMSLVAYSLATDWLVLQAKVAENPSVALQEQLPTPLQYALLLQICGSTSFEAVRNTLRYMLRNKGSQASVPAILKKAVAWLITLLAITLAIGWTDFWLHENVKVVQIVHVEPGKQPKPYGMRLNNTLCPQGGVADQRQRLPCLVTPDHLNGGFEFAQNTDYNREYVASQGVLTFRGMGSKYEVSTLNRISNDVSASGLIRSRFAAPDASDKASLVFITSPQIRLHEIFKVSTIGMMSSCQIITPMCQPTSDSFNCTSAGLPRIHSSLSPILSSRIFIGDNDTVVDDALDRNPIQVSILATFPTQDLDEGLTKTGLEVITHNNQHYIYTVATCNLTYFDLDLSFFNGTFDIDESKLSLPMVARSLSGPIFTGMVTNPLVASLTSSAGKVTQEMFTNQISYAFSYTSLGLASGLLSPIDVDVLHSKIILASQYPKLPLYFYFTLLYMFSAVALVLFFWAWSTSSDCVTYNCPKTGKPIQVRAAVLAQRVLMDPGYLVATHLGGLPRQTRSTTNHASAAAATWTQPSPLMVEVDEKEAFSRAGGGRKVDSDTVWDKPSQMNRQAAIRTTSTDLLSLFDEPAHQERVVIGLEGSGQGFGVWGMSQALGAVGQDDPRYKRESMLRACTIFSQNHRNHQSELVFPNQLNRGET